MSNRETFRTRASNYTKFKNWVLENCDEWDGGDTEQYDFKTYELNGILFHVLPGTSKHVSEYINIAYKDDRDDSEIAHILNLTRPPEYKDEHILVNNHDAAEMLGTLMHTAEMAKDLQTSLPKNEQATERRKPFKV